jgi:hypothetical protein
MTLSGILSAVTEFFKGLGKIADYFKQRDLIDTAQDAERGRNAVEELQNLEEAKSDAEEARDALDDDAERDSLRDRFTRPE